MHSQLTTDDRTYLVSRGYREEDLDAEEIYSYSNGALYGIEPKTNGPVIAFVSRDALGNVIGIHTASRTVKDYRYFQHPAKLYAPIMYGSADDFVKVLTDGKLILVEGVFDRIAMKLFLPDYAVIARLSRGIPQGLLWFIKRYIKQLVLAFDEDEAGQDGTEKAERALQRTLDVVRLHFPVKDPSDFLSKYGVHQGRQRLLAQLESAL